MSPMSALRRRALRRRTSGRRPLGRRGPAAALACLAVAVVVVSGCGTNDDGGVITPANTTTIAPRARSGSGGVPD